MKIVSHWREVDFNETPVGGKARALGALSRAGFSVPRWIVVLPSAADVAESELARELKSFLNACTGLLAVRSSAVGEDGQTHSFAGQLESFLEVEPSQVLARIRDVWASGSSERIIAYRSQAGLALPPPRPAVIVQDLVAAEWAGVAFGADPVSGSRSTAVVAAVRGLGECLVAGETTGDTFHVDRAGRIVQRSSGEQSEPTLRDPDIVRVAQLVRQTGRLFGLPQDIEWAMAGGKLSLLQSRPITSLANRQDPDGAWQLWDNSNIAESYSGVTTPLTFSFAKEIYEEVYRQFVKILQVPIWRIEASRDVFARMLGLIRGQIYYNLLSWYRVLAMLPGFAVNRRFMEQMMGVKESLPDNVVAGIVGDRKKPTPCDYVEVLGTLLGLLSNHVLLKKKIKAFQERLDEALALEGGALEDMRPDELAAAYRKLQNQLLTRWDAPLINDFFAMIYFGLSRRLVDKWCGDPDGTLQNDLIACQGGILSAEPARRMIRLAAMVRENPILQTLLSGASRVDIEASLDEHPVFRDEYHAYLDKFGDRCLEELKLESATLHDDPMMLLQSVSRLAAQPARANLDTKEIAAVAARRVKASLEGHPLRQFIFNFIIAQTRHRIRDRENLRFERTRVFGRVRRIFVELGKRLHGLGVLDDHRDIFFLETEEGLGFVEGTATCTHLNALAGIRKKEFAAFLMDSPSGRFETRGVVYVGHDFQSKKAIDPKASEGETRKGVGCCPGLVRARARVILDARHAEIENGDILVAPRTDPGWIMLFPAAAGLLVEHGSLLSHSAIVSREMGIPAVVSVEGLTTWLRTGDLVELDGSSGRVTRISAAEDSDAE